MKNILILTDADFVGGAETNYNHILPQLYENGWNPILVSSGSENLKAYFENQHIKVEIQPAFGKYFSFSKNNRVSPRNIFLTWLAVLKNRSVLKKLISKYQPVAVVSNSMVSHWVLSYTNTGSRCRKIMHMHDIVDLKKGMGLYAKGLNRIASRMNAVIVVSESVRMQFSSQVQSKIKKIYNPAEAILPTRYKKPGEIIRVGMFARYTPWKGHRDLLDIAKSFPSAGYEFVSFGNHSGNEKYFLELKKTSAGLPNAASIQLNGFCSDISLEMAKCDIILQLSVLPDPSPKIMVEANLCHVPIYAYEGGGVKEQFEELSLAGVMVPSGDKESMILEIKKFREKNFIYPDLKELNPSAYFLKFASVLDGDPKKTHGN